MTGNPGSDPLAPDDTEVAPDRHADDRDRDPGPAGNPDRQDGSKEDSEWELWPPSPKMQIILIAVAFGLFNCILFGAGAMIIARHM